MQVRLSYRTALDLEAYDAGILTNVILRSDFASAVAFLDLPETDAPSP